MEMFQEAFGKSLNRMKESFLYAAALGGNVDDCDSLLSLGANCDWTNSNGDTPLMAGCRREHIEVVKILLVFGADTSIAGADLQYPIHVAASSGNMSILNSLLDAGCDASVRNGEGRSAVELGKMFGHTAVVRRLEEALAKQLTRAYSNNDTASPSISARNTLIASETPASSGLTLSSSSPSRRPAQLPAISSPSSSTVISPNTSGSEEESKNYYSLQDPACSLLPSTATKDCCQVFKHLYTNECKQRRLLEQKLESLKLKASALTSQLSTSYQQNLTLEDNINKVNEEIKHIRGENIESLTKNQCDTLEKDLRYALERIEVRKNDLLEDEVNTYKNQRACVVCQERDKSVVLLPCRHMCLCDVCGAPNNLQIKLCPLCRRDIDGIIIHVLDLFKAKLRQ